jgi:hypothetical protein
MASTNRDSWTALRGAVVGIPSMLSAALVGERPRVAAMRVARIVQQLHADAVAELGEREAEDLVGATLRLVRDRVIDIFGPSAWDDASRIDPA